MAEPLPQEDNAADRRRFPRVAVPLNVRYLLPDGEERTADTEDLSACGAFIHTGESEDGPGVAVDDHVIAYVDKLGRIEGTVVRVADDGFALDLRMTPAKQERLAKALERVAEGESADALAETRRHARIDGEDHPTRLVLPDGLIRSCRIIDMSIGGALLDTPERPSVGAEVRLGQMRARVVRHHDQGIAVEFTDVARSPRALIDHFRAHPAEDGENVT